MKVTQKRTENKIMTKIAEALQPRSSEHTSPSLDKRKSGVNRNGKKPHSISNAAVVKNHMIDDVTDVHAPHAVARSPKTDSKHVTFMSAESSIKSNNNMRPDEIEKLKEQQELFSILKDLENLNQINEKFCGGRPAADLKDTGLMAEYKPLIPVDKPHFERFFELKQEIRQQQLSDLAIENAYVPKKVEEKDVYDHLINQKKFEVICNVFPYQDPRTKMFIGEGS